MHDIIASLIVATVLAAKPTAGTNPGFDFTPWFPLLGVVLGGLISALVSFFLNGRTNKQQLARDQEANRQQLARDQEAYTRQEARDLLTSTQQTRRDLEAHQQQRDRDMLAYSSQARRDQEAYQQQKEREQTAYERSLRDAKRDRLRDAYKVVLIATNTYMAVLQEMQVIKEGETEETRDKRLNTLLGEALSGMDDAMAVVTLENVGDDIETAFWTMHGAFRGYTLQRGANKMYAGSFTQADFDKERSKVIQSRDALIALMREHLKEFEK